MENYDLTINKELRDTYMERVEVLDKVKKLFLIPGMEVMTTKQVADYFEVDVEAIQKTYQRNQIEIDSDGVLVKKPADFRNGQDVQSVGYALVESKRAGIVIVDSIGNKFEINNRGTKCFSQRAILRIAMLLRDSVVAKEIRTQLFKEIMNNDTYLTSNKKEVQSMDKFDIVKSLVNQKFGEVRVIVEDDSVLFCGSDVAKALGYARPIKAIIDHCKGVLKRDILTNGGNQEMSFIPEGDVYRLIIKSKLPEAEEFEHWLFDEMLPTLRKTGGYISDSEKFANIYFQGVSIEQKQIVISQLNRIMELQNVNSALVKENDELTKVNKLLSDGINTWDNKAVLNAMVRAAAVKSFDGNFGKAWGSYYKQLQYKAGINLTSRSGIGGKIDKIKGEEWPEALQVGAAWLIGMDVDVVAVINSVNASVVNQ